MSTDSGKEHPPGEGSAAGPEADPSAGPRAGHPAAVGCGDLLKIGVFAREAETNLRTLRYYEEIGLLAPALRSEGGFRYYRATDINRVHLIRNLQDLGLQLEQIGGLLRIRDDGAERGAWLERIQAAFSEQETRIQDRIQDLEQQRELIQTARKKLQDCSSCEHRPSAENNFCEPCQRSGLPLPEYLSALF